MLITTSIDLPGYEVVAVQGEVFGLTVRSRNIGAGCLAGLRSIGGGEIPEFTRLLTQSRNEAMAHEPSHVPPPLASPVPPALPSLSASSSTVSTSWRMPSAR